MRDGNALGAGKTSKGKVVVSLPMRDGNLGPVSTDNVVIRVLLAYL